MRHFSAHCLYIQCCGYSLGIFITLNVLALGEIYKDICRGVMVVPEVCWVAKETKFHVSVVLLVARMPLYPNRYFLKDYQW